MAKTKFKPILACNAPKKIIFPLLASAKMDGVRGLVFPEGIKARSMKLIPNKHVQKTVDRHLQDLCGLDGELIVGKPYDEGVYNATVSGVMSKDGEPSFSYYVFDDTLCPEAMPFNERYAHLKSCAETLYPSWVKVIEQHMIWDQPELDAFENNCLDIGYEGVVLRKLNGVYKHGASTQKEGYFMRLKRFVDDEAVIIGFEERMHNANVPMRDELGAIKRSSAKAGKQPMGTLGALHVQDIKTQVQFKIGSGFDDKQRQEIWDNREFYLMTIAKYKHFPSGTKDKPRFPTFLGFRDPDDMSERK